MCDCKTWPYNSPRFIMLRFYGTLPAVLDTSRRMGDIETVN
jgi:hypothetical protein